MKNKIEATLKCAIGRCKKDGGYFYDQEGPHRWEVDEHGRIVNCDDGTMFELHQKDFERKWIYEPPQQSAFQKWMEKDPPCYKQSNLHYVQEGRREGWNAAIDDVLELPSGLDMLVDRIKDLKEP